MLCGFGCQRGGAFSFLPCFSPPPFLPCFLFQDLSLRASDPAATGTGPSHSGPEDPDIDISRPPELTILFSQLADHFEKTIQEIFKVSRRILSNLVDPFSVEVQILRMCCTILQG